MKMTQEYDGSIVIHNQVVGKFEIDGFTDSQNRALNDEIVRRWNMAIVKECGCGRSYTMEEFRALHYKGIQPMDDGDQPAAYEYHDCICGSTLAIELFTK